MKSNELKDQTNTAVLLEAQDLGSTDTKTSLLDLSASRVGAAVIEICVGALTGVDGSNKVAFSLVEGNTTADSALTAVSADDMAGVSLPTIDSTTEDSTVIHVPYCGSKRYVGVNIDYTGTGITAGIVGVYALVGMGSSEPLGAPTVVART